MAKNHRSPKHTLPIIPYVCPDGRIVDAQWAPAISNTVLVADDTGDVKGSNVHVREAKRREGYRLLRELFEAESKADVFKDYMAWAKAVYHEGHTKAFPDEALPAEVLTRRTKAAKGEVIKWTPSEATQRAMAKPEPAKAKPAEHASTKSAEQASARPSEGS